MAWTISEPTEADLDELGRVHVRVWQEAYAGLLPDDYLAGLDPTAGPARWRERLGSSPEVGWWLARDLTSASKMQDCLMSGRSNCNVIEPAR